MRLLVCLAALVWTVQAAYNSSWASIDSRPCPSWYDDAKFGIFIHWGVYSVPSWAPVGTYAEWYWNALETKGSSTQTFHNATYGPNFKYQEFAPLFRAELFDPTAWAQLIVQSGAKYVVPTSKHHEGFTLWQSPQSWNWNAVDVGPHRDLLGAIMKEVAAAGLHPGLYFSLYEWFHPLYRGPDPQQYVQEVMLPQLYDLITNYQPHVLWTDGEWEQSSEFWHSTDFLAWLFNSSPVKDIIVINDRWGNDTRDKHGGFFTPEYSSSVYLDHKWEENSGIDMHSYGLNRNSQAWDYLSSEYLINLLVKSVANGGNLLLDIGPAADGSIPPIMEERLTDIGAWLKVNGEAIYSSRIWRVQMENSTYVVYYTTQPSTKAVYALVTSWPGEVLKLTSPVFSASAQATLLGYNQPLKVQGVAGQAGLTVQMPTFMPGQLPCQYVWTVKLVNIS